MRRKNFEDFICDEILLQPFNLLISEDQYIYLENILSNKKKKELTKEEQKEICKELNLSYNKRKQAPKVKFLTFKSFKCNNCNKILFCEHINKDDNKKIISTFFLTTKKHRQLVNLLNQNNLGKAKKII